MSAKEIRFGIEVFKSEIRYYYDESARKTFWGKWIYGRRQIDGVVGWTCIGGRI